MAINKMIPAANRYRLQVVGEMGKKVKQVLQQEARPTGEKRCALCSSA
ncbi:hypothetical protein SG34_013940 [Thalassomonas viridans]|uniref:Uncharacterized protein n=1 Tax=Thalassomonas viridans TaxID=137584 RepID=A0AAE9Z9P1_9GAMM|nr:hypothetical protein [Thalassomonas viridans]WDE07883.1 hypothetical protein SG34_013940 [Thalassomonas viridans]